MFSIGIAPAHPFLMSEQNPRTNKLFSPYMYEVTFKHYDKLKFTLSLFGGEVSLAVKKLFQAHRKLETVFYLCSMYLMAR